MLRVSLQKHFSNYAIAARTNVTTIARRIDRLKGHWADPYARKTDDGPKSSRVASMDRKTQFC